MRLSDLDLRLIFFCVKSYFRLYVKNNRLTFNDSLNINSTIQLSDS